MNCPAFSACGGDVVGTWVATSVCGSVVPDSTAPECTNELTNEKISGSESVTFGSDGTLNESSSITATVDLSINDACAQATSMTDAQTFCSFLALASGSGGSAGSAGSGVDVNFDCTYTAPACTCHVLESGDVMETGTYTISGTQITTTVPSTTTGGSPTVQTGDFCVQGNTLTLHQTSDTGGDQLTVLTRQ
jgi:hypothetical protein